MIHRSRLEDGAAVIVETRRSAPLAACWLRFDVGARFEARDEWGAAHFVEHMLFKGSRSFGVGEVGSRMDALGGDLNAYTSHEEVVLHCVLPSRHLEEALAVLGDIAFHPAMDPEEVERERLVILDEISEGQDDPERVLAEALAARAWGSHPYGRPVLGPAAAIRQLDAGRLAAFHRRWFRPATASLVVVGDVDPEAVLVAAGRHLAGTREPAPPRPHHPVPPPARELSLVRVQGAFQELLVELALPVPPLGHPDLPALDLLVSALGEGASALLPSRLHNELGRVHSAWTASEASRDGGLLVLGMAPADDDLEGALEALGTVLWEVADRGLPLDRFQRARTALLADRLYASETAETRAATLSWYHGFLGSVDAEVAYRARVEALTPADVAAVARTYLRPHRGTLALVGPRLRLGRGDAEALLAPPSPPLRGHVRRRRPTSGPGQPRVARATLPGGIRVLVEPDPDAPLASVRVVGLGGALLETPATSGHSRAWADLVAEGGGDLDPVTWAAAVEALSGSVEGFSGLSTMGLSATFPGDRFVPGLVLALLPLVRPCHEPETVDRVVRALQDALRTREDDPLAVAWEHLFGDLFPGHPFGIPAGGTAASLNVLDCDALARVHRRGVHAPNMVVAVAGAVDPDAVLPLLEGALAPVSRRAVALPSRRLPAPAARTREVRGPWRQAYLLVGMHAAPAGHEDAPALEVLSTLLGSQGGRLFRRLREEAGISYDLQARHVGALGAGAFTCSVATAPDRLPEARAAVLEVLGDLLQRPPNEEEVGRARAALAGATLQELERASFRAGRMAQDERLGQDGTRYREHLRDVEAVDARALQAAVARWIRLDRLVEVRALPGGSPSREA